MPNENAVADAELSATTDPVGLGISPSCCTSAAARGLSDSTAWRAPF